MRTSTAAIVFSPSRPILDALSDRQTFEFADARGYRMVGCVCEWALVDHLLAAGAIQVVLFADRPYVRTHGPRTRRAITCRTMPGAVERDGSVYETARLLPRGDDGGFAERFLRDRQQRRDT